MAATSQQIARKLIQLSMDADGALDPERVEAVLEWTRRLPVVRRRRTLRLFLRRARAELSRRQAIVEHAGPIDDAALEDLRAALAEHAGHPVSISPRENPKLIAGIRIRLGDDLLDASVAGRLQRFAATFNGHSSS